MHSHYVITPVNGTMSQRLLCLSLQDTAPGSCCSPHPLPSRFANVLSLSGASPPALWALSQLGDEADTTGSGRGVNPTLPFPKSAHDAC